MKPGGRLDNVCRVSTKIKPQENLHLSNDFKKRAPKEKKKEIETQEQNQSIRSFMGQRIELQEGSNEHFHMKHKRSTKN